MSRYRIYKLADKYGVSHGTASFIYDHCASVDEFIEALIDYAAGRGFSLS